MAENQYQTVNFDELEMRLQDYTLPADFDWSTVSSDIAALQQNWGDDAGYLQLSYRYYSDGTCVLTAIHHKLQTGAVDAMAQWETKYADNDLDTMYDPALVAAGTGESPPAVAAPPDFRSCWADTEWANTFAEWARANYVGESVDFLLWLQQSYKPSPTWEWADHLFNTFIVEGAPQQVNVDSATVNGIRARMPMAGRQRMQPPADLFDAAETEITALIENDVYRRFVAAQQGQ